MNFPGSSGALSVSEGVGLAPTFPKRVTTIKHTMGQTDHSVVPQYLNFGVESSLKPDTTLLGF